MTRTFIPLTLFSSFHKLNQGQRYCGNMSHKKTDIFTGVKHRLSEYIDVDVSADYSTATVSLPGFGMDDLDRALCIAPWKLTKLGEAGRTSAFGLMGDIGSNTLYKMGQLVKDRLVFLVSNCIHVNPNLYKPMVQFHPVKYNMKLFNYGKSSMTQLDELILAGTGEVLSQSVVKLVLVDLETRRPIDHPEWFTDLFRDVTHQPPLGIDPHERMDKMQPPERCYVYKTKIVHSDLDYYLHTNHASYVRIVCDATTSASVSGKLEMFNGDLSFQKVRKMHFVYQGETSAGDDIEVLVWQEKGCPETILTQLQKDGSVIFLAKFVYEIPKILNSSQL